MTANEIGLGAGLRALIEALDSGVEQHYRQLGETFRPRYFPVVRCLIENQLMTVGGLALQCGVSQPAMSQTLAAMRRDGIVAMREGGNGRERPVVLTTAGSNQADRLARHWHAIARAAARLEAEHGAPLGQIVGRLLNALERKGFTQRIEEEL